LLLFRKCLEVFRSITNAKIRTQAAALQLGKEKDLTDKETAMSKGEWAWKNHPKIFQYSKTYVRLSGSYTPTEGRSFVTVIVVGEGEDENEESEEDLYDQKLVDDDL
jgi:hypothetical protein